MNQDLHVVSMQRNWWRNLLLPGTVTGHGHLDLPARKCGNNLSSDSDGDPVCQQFCHNQDCSEQEEATFWTFVAETFCEHLTHSRKVELVVTFGANRGSMVHISPPPPHRNRYVRLRASKTTDSSAVAVFMRDGKTEL